MAITYTKSGSAAAADIVNMTITRSGAGQLSGSVTYKATVAGQEITKTATWTLSGPDKTKVAGLLPNALAAIDGAT